MMSIIRGSRFRALLLILAFIWLLWIAFSYAQLVTQLPIRLVESTIQNLLTLFKVQILLFLIVLVFLSVPSLRRFKAQLTLGFFILSTLYILAIPGDWVFAAKFLVFIVWWFFALASVRFSLKSLLPQIATWGLASGILIGILVPVWFFLGIGGILNIWTVGFIFITPLIPGLIRLRLLAREVYRNLISSLNKIDPLGFASLEVLFILLTISFIWTNSPEAGSDSARSHLPLAQNYSDTGSLTQYFVNWGRFMPKAAQTWSAAAIVVGGIQFTKWLSWFYLLICGVLIGEEMYRRTRSFNFSLMSAAIILSCPYLLYLSTTLYIDHLILLLNLTVIFLVFRCRGPDQMSILAISAVVAGGLAQIKYNTLLFVIVWCGLVAWYLFTNHRFSRAFKSAFFIAVIFLISASPWYIYTYSNTGNPLFPYFNSIFDSTLWPEGSETTLGQDRYSLGEGRFAWLKFPWTAAMKASEISNRHDGIMGYWMLALIPFTLFGFSRRLLRIGLEPFVTGILGILLVALFTLNSRYWLPAYPLLLSGLLLGAFVLLEKAGIRFYYFLKTAGGILLVLLTIISIPFWTAFNHLGWFPFEVYTGEKSKQEWMRFLYPGTPAVETLNQFVNPEEGVLVTNFEAVYAVQARAYEFPFWHTNILDLKTPESFKEFQRTNHIRYWVVNLRETDDNHFLNGRFETESRFWTDDRLVAASHQVAIYDLSDNWTERKLIENRVITPPMTLCKEKGTEHCSGWHFSNPVENSPVNELGNGKIEIPADGNIRKVFPIPGNPSLIEFSIRAHAEQRTTLILSLEWLNQEGDQIGSVQGSLASKLKFDLFKGPIYGNIPPGTDKVRIRIRPWRTTVAVFDARLRFLEFEDAPNQ